MGGCVPQGVARDLDRVLSRRVRGQQKPSLLGHPFATRSQSLPAQQPISTSKFLTNDTGSRYPVSRRTDPPDWPRMGFALGNAFAGTVVKRYLGIDPGLNRTGYALLERTAAGPRLLEGGIIASTAPRSLSSRCNALKSATASATCSASSVLRRWPLSQIFSHPGHPKTAVLMAHARGAILFAAADAGVSIVHYTPRQVEETPHRQRQGEQRASASGHPAASSGPRRGAGAERVADAFAVASAITTAPAWTSCNSPPGGVRPHSTGGARRSPAGSGAAHAAGPHCSWGSHSRPACSSRCRRLWPPT